jgi:4-hydroxy-tetrahydrodipicolinate synthase
LVRQVDYHLAGGVHGLLVLGTIGEGEQADMAERAVVIQTVCSHVSGRVPVVIGIHTADVEVARAQMEQAQQLGAAAVLIKYLPRRGACVRFTDVYTFYRDLALAQVLPIFVYYFPSQTGVELTPAEVAQLLRLRGVVGIKNSLLDLGHVQKQMELTQRLDVAFLSGTALNLTQFHAIGGHGAMCPEALLLPGPTVAAWQAAVEGRSTEARQRQKTLFAVAPLLTRPAVTARTARTVTMLNQDLGRRQEVGPEATPARLKFAMNALGVPMSELVKPPLSPLGRMERLWVEAQLPGLLRVGSQW